MADEALAFAHRVLLLRNSRGWTQKDLGDRMVPRTNAGAISSIETGHRNPNQRTVIALARAFHLPVHALYGSGDTEDALPLLSLVLAELLREAAQESEEVHRALLALLRACRTSRQRPAAPDAGGA